MRASTPSNAFCSSKPTQRVRCELPDRGCTVRHDSDSKGTEDVIAKLVPGASLGLSHLSDDELLANTRRLVGKTNQLFAALLAHLAEVEDRGIHRTRRCASLYTYCIYELRFSEDAAARRSAAARLVKQFPPLFDAITNGELHLTGLLMIGPHLTLENHIEVLGRAKFRTKKELGKLVRDLNPLPQVPDRIEPLGPPQLRALRNPTWEEYVTSLAPRVRELPPEEQPRGWANVEGETGKGETGEGRALVHLATKESRCAADEAVAADGSGNLRETAQPEQPEPLPVGPVPQNLPPVTGPQRYQVQFCTVEEHAQLVERAKALLASTHPRLSLGELHLQAMKAFVASLEKRKFSVNDRPHRGAKATRTKAASQNEKVPTAARQPSESETPLLDKHNPPRQRGESETPQPDNRQPPRQRGESETPQPDNRQPPRQRGESETRERESCAAPLQRGGSKAPKLKAQQRDWSELPEIQDDDSTQQPGGSELESKSRQPRRQRGESEARDIQERQPPRQRGESETRDIQERQPPRQRGDDNGRAGNGGDVSDQKAKTDDRRVAATHQRDNANVSSSKRTRYVPACERREVYQRDVGRCTYVDTRGERCCETRYLELHHLQPFAERGASIAANLTLRRAAHNALAAEEDFGAQLIRERRDAGTHEALAAQQLVTPDAAS